MKRITLTEDKAVFRKVLTELIDAPAEEGTINYIVRLAKHELVDLLIEECEDYENFLVEFELGENDSACEIYEITKNTCRRADGQYILKGAFTPREVCEQHIKEKVRVLTLTATRVRTEEYEC